MSRDDTFDDVLRAFAGDLPDPVEQEELDRVYSQAVAEGLIGEADIKRSFEEFLNRPVERVPETGELRLVPPAPVTVGAFVKASRRTRGLTCAEFAQELQVRPEDMGAIEACGKTYDPERLSEAARALAVTVPTLTPAGAQRLLQRLRVMSGLRDAAGPLLKAARQPLGK